MKSKPLIYKGHAFDSLGAGYGPRAVDSILEEYFEKYMQDVPQFETMLKEYEENKHVED